MSNVCKYNMVCFKECTDDCPQYAPESYVGEMCEIKFSIKQDPIRQMAEKAAKKKGDMALYLFLSTAIKENITLRQAYERYELMENEDMQTTEHAAFTLNIEYQCDMRLVRRPPVTLSDQYWADFCKMIDSVLYKKFYEDRE